MTTRRGTEDAKKGSAEVIILAIVEREAHHGYEIAKLIEERSAGSLTFTLATLYATLYRLEDRGWIKGRWVEKAGARRRSGSSRRARAGGRGEVRVNETRLTEIP